jgi:hypothetical protein
MTSLHKNFPLGKGMWIWNLKDCENGNIPAIITKCKAYNITYVLVKCADGGNTWPQYTPELIKEFHDAGIKIYAWAYNYGQDAAREAAVALWALDMQPDGFVFDAEYEEVANPTQSAEITLKTIREKHPEAFLAYAPYPIIDYHTRFPYATFGKYCDAAMPQMYWGTIGISVAQMYTDMYEQWSRYEQSWKDSGHADSIKPIIPLGQTYDNPQTNFVATPKDVAGFISAGSGYFSVCFWEWAHTLRDDLWGAIRDTQVKTMPASVTPVNTPVQDSGLATPINPNTTNTPSSTTPSVVPTPVTAVNGQTDPGLSITGSTTATNPVEIEDEVITTTPTETIVAKIPLPADKAGATIRVTPNESSPTGMDLKVTYHKTHLDYLLEFLRWLHIIK